MTSETVVLMVGLTGVRTGIAGTAVALSMTGEAVGLMMNLAIMSASVAGTATAPSVTDEAVVLVVGFAVVGTVGVALVGTGGAVGTARYPALHTNVADGGVAASDAQAAGAVMLPTGNGVASHGWFSAKIACVFRGIHLTDRACYTRVGLTSVGILIV